jgi:hypothetical protein
MYYLKVILLQNKSPTCKLSRQLVGLHQPLERLVISDKGEFGAEQITSEV